MPKKSKKATSRIQNLQKGRKDAKQRKNVDTSTNGDASSEVTTLTGSILSLQQCSVTSETVDMRSLRSNHSMTSRRPRSHLSGNTSLQENNETRLPRLPQSPSINVNDNQETQHEEHDEPTIVVPPVDEACGSPDEPLSQLSLQTLDIPTFPWLEVLGAKNEHDGFIYASIGTMTAKCSRCHALHFLTEKYIEYIGSNGQKQKSYGSCCVHGQVSLPMIRSPPSYLKALLCNNVPGSSAHFMDHIKLYNAAFAMISYEISKCAVHNIKGQHLFCIQGTPFHRIFPAEPPQGLMPRSGQIFFLDAEQGNSVRDMFTNVRPGIIRCLWEDLMSVNPHMQNFNTMREMFQAERERAHTDGRNLYSMTISLVQPTAREMSTNEGRTFALPVNVSYEVAAVYEGDAPPENVLLQIYPRSQHSKVMSHMNPLADPLTYPLIFPHGELGYRIRIPLRKNTAVSPNDDNDECLTERRKHVTIRQFYAFYLFARNRCFNPIHRSGRLFQQFVVDAGLKIDRNRIEWLRNNQDQLLCTSRQRLNDYVANQAERRGLLPGRVMGLPANFVGSPAYYNRNYLNTTALLRFFNKPCLFITFTCNPKWNEIRGTLRARETAANRPDIVSQAFLRKFELFLDALDTRDGTNGLFGKCNAHAASIEMQKRGLPHAHLLLWLSEVFRILTAEHVDAFVRADIPDPVLEPLLFKAVVTHMLHNKCGCRNQSAPCMVNGKCSKGYPKPYCEETVLNGPGGRPQFKRPNNGRTYVSPSGIIYTNQDVVPYNPMLLLMFDCHINVDVVTSFRALKYIAKYIFKGCDALSVRLQVFEETMADIPATTAVHEEDAAQNDGDNTDPQNDEPQPVSTPEDADPEQQRGGFLDYDEGQAYLKLKYSCPNGTMLRILQKTFHSISHHIVALPVHDEGDGKVIYKASLTPEEIAEKLDVFKPTKLEAAMLLYGGPLRNVASQYLYCDLVQRFRYDDSGLLVPRVQQKGLRYERTLGVLTEVSPKRYNLYFIRLLLMHQRGYRDFKELRTVDGVSHDTFREACIALNLLQNDKCHEGAMTAAAMFRFPGALRHFFVMMIIHVTPAEPVLLFNKFWKDMSADYLHRHGLDDNAAREKLLRYICQNIIRNGGDVPEGWQELEELHSDPSVLEEAFQPLPRVIHSHDIEGNLASLNAEQSYVLRRVLDIILNHRDAAGCVQDSPNVFLLSGAGGCGKTFVYKQIIDILQSQNLTSVSVAWTGIAAMLLPNGCTSHSAFGLPFIMSPEASSSLDLCSRKAQILRTTSIIIWDEIFMAHKEALRILDDLMKAVKNNSLPFGGTLMLFGGDVRQILPVVTGVGSVEAAMASPVYSKLFPSISIMNLTTNMRAVSDPVWSEYLLRIGNGTHKRVCSTPQIMEIPDDLKINKSELVNWVFGEDPSTTAAGRAILTPKNVSAFELNDEVLKLLPGPVVELLSTDVLPDIRNADDLYLPIEQINAMTPSGMPPHCLKLKPGAVVILLRNLDITNQLCNGTRLRVNTIHRDVLECTILDAVSPCEQSVFIPRMTLKYDGRDSPVPFSRTQFPVRLGFVLTINKSQGKTFDRIGLYLPSPPFQSGGMYVAMSRVRSRSDVKIAVEPHPQQGIVNGKTVTINLVDHGVMQAFNNQLKVSLVRQGADPPSMDELLRQLRPFSINTNQPTDMTPSSPVIPRATSPDPVNMLSPRLAQLSLSDNSQNNNSPEPCFSADDEPSLVAAETTPVILPPARPRVRTPNLPCGLTNLGSTCYMNATLQTLISLRTFTELLNNSVCQIPPGYAPCLFGHSMDCADFCLDPCVGCYLKIQLTAIKDCTFASMDPMLMAKGLPEISRTYRIGQQHDMPEFLNLLVQRLDEKHSTNRQFFKCFQIETAVECVCDTCDTSTQVQNSFFGIVLPTVDATGTSYDTTEDMIHNWLNPQNVDFECSNLDCGELKRKAGKLSVAVAPDVLSVQYARYNIAGRKNETLFDVQQFFRLPLLNNSGEAVYKLTAIVNHAGKTVNSGHYTCDVSHGSQFVRCDDSQVHHVDTYDRKTCYVMFYERVENVAPQPMQQNNATRKSDDISPRISGKRKRKKV